MLYLIVKFCILTNKNRLKKKWQVNKAILIVHTSKPWTFGVIMQEGVFVAGYPLDYVEEFFTSQNDQNADLTENGQVNPYYKSSVRHAPGTKI